MSNAVLQSLFVLASLAGGPVDDGQAWLEKAASHLYAWPKPGTLVHFQVRTNVLEDAIAALEKDPDLGADADKSRWVEALRNPTIQSTMNTETGKVTTEVLLRFEPASPQGRALSDKMKAGLATMVSSAFQGLPFHDPSLLRKGGSVLGMEEQADAVAVTLTGKDGKDRSTLRLNRRTELPEIIETGGMTMRLRYVEVVPGRFAPSRLEVKPRSGDEGRAEYTYQKAGEIAFPATVRLVQGKKTITLSFVSLKVDPLPL